MALRLVEIFLPDEDTPGKRWSSEHPLIGQWPVSLEDDGRLIRALINTEHAEAFLDDVEKEFGSSRGFRIVMLPVEATVPIEREENTKGANAENRQGASRARVSREELYQDVAEPVQGTVSYFTLVILSTIVAAGGMMRDDVAVVVGAMVIAPLIGPNLALALGTTLGDRELFWKALKVNFLGLVAALALSILIGLTIEFSPSAGQIAARTQVDLQTVALALAAGVAGALSVTRGMPTALIGVMVAVALLPPLVATGMLLGGGFWLPAYGSGLLLLVNVTSINLAAVLTFGLQGIRPSTWYEAEEARKKMRFAVALWLALLAILVAAVVLSPTELIPK